MEDTYMSRKPLIAGNWKMNKTLSESVDLAKGIAVSDIDFSTRDVLVAPTFTNLYAVSEAVKQNGGRVYVSAQNMYFEQEGAFTGEISADMIKSTGAGWVILGHSERRSIFGETDEVINKKVKKALSSGLSVILCVGETLWEREAGAEVETVLAQTGKGLEGVSDLSKVVIAYEPVWAIGTGRTASPADAQAMHKAIREYIAKIRDKKTSEEIRILYGGSMKPENAKELMMQEDIDGGLVGGASLKADQFLKIINFDK